VVIALFADRRNATGLENLDQFNWVGLASYEILFGLDKTFPLIAAAVLLKLITLLLELNNDGSEVSKSRLV
jgi:ABC-type polysaccharide transport system permease subunit